MWLLVPLAILCTLSALVAYRFAERFASESYDMLLMKSADSIASRLSRNEQGVVVSDLPVAAQAILRHNFRDQFYYQIADRYGHRLTGDAVLPLPVNIEDKGPRFRYASINGQTVRVCRISIEISPSPDEIWVQVAETLNSRRELLGQIFLSILVPQLIMVVLASLSVWLGVTSGLSPLEKLGRLLESRKKLDLSPVDIGRTPAELAPVTTALNELFLNANNHIRLQRQFVANAAHQLRTPVTALKTYIDYAERIKDSDAATLSTLLDQMSKSAGRVAHMVSRLLSLARTEERNRKELDVVDLTGAIDEAAASVIHEALSRGVSLEFDMPDTPVNIRADRGDLVEMITNLLDNAIRYTKEKGSVWVKLKDSDQITLTIEDDGPGIPDAEKSRVFERFYRMEGSNGPGCGLGLSIVSEIAAANHATVEILDRPGGGARFSVTYQR